MKANINWGNILILAVICLVVMPLLTFAAVLALGPAITIVMFPLSFVVGFMSASIFKPVDWTF